MDQLITSAPNLLPSITMSNSSPDALRLQHLYTLAFADRMRMLQQPFGQLGHFPPLMGVPPMSGQRFAPPADLAMFPLAKLDPRLFRIPFPEEPKPQHSYIGLIAMGILSSTEKKLVLADIYQYVLDNFPYFRHRGPGWRNSIRHNLSLNDCFIKSGRASNGKGHFWAVHPACADDFQKGDFSRRKAQRKVRRYLGLHQDEEDEDTPPVSPPPSLHTFKLYDHSPFRALAAAAEETVRPKPFSFGIDCILGKQEQELEDEDKHEHHQAHQRHQQEQGEDDSKSDIDVDDDNDHDTYRLQHESHKPEF